MRAMGLMICALLVGCGSAPSEAQLMESLSDERVGTADKMRAIDRLGSRAPARLGPKLVRLLDHPDGALRRYAWIELEALLGRRLVFEPYGPIERRRRQIREIEIIWRRIGAEPPG